MKGWDSMCGIDKQRFVGYLMNYWKENKAKGLMAQLYFKKEIKNGIFQEYKLNFFDWCWILAPKRSDFYRFRFCFFVYPEVFKKPLNEDMKPEDIMGEVEGLKFRMIAGFLDRAGMGVIYAIRTEELLCSNENPGNWRLYRYNSDNDNLQQIDVSSFFSHWEGTGRQSSGGEWDESLKEEYLKLEEKELMSLVLNEAFYTTLLKGFLRKPVSDPYDVDGFFLSYTNRIVLPLEIKEKYPAETNGEKFFGIDAGRVLMLLRLCLPNDANAFYVIREVCRDSRNFIDWKFTTLSEIILGASWNLQKGGRGMEGQETQTIRLQYNSFKKLEPSVLSNDNLKKIGCLPNEIKKLAVEFRNSIRKEYYGIGF
jgi:hypothetical protein